MSYCMPYCSWMRAFMSRLLNSVSFERSTCALYLLIHATGFSHPCTYFTVAGMKQIFSKFSQRVVDLSAIGWCTLLSAMSVRIRAFHLQQHVNTTLTRTTTKLKTVRLHTTTKSKSVSATIVVTDGQEF